MTPSLVWVEWIESHVWELAYIWGGLMVVSAGIKVQRMRRVRKASTTRGSATFATPSEIRHAGLLTGPGVILGETTSFGRRQYLRAGGEHNILVMGPKGSGKTTVVTVKAICCAEESLVILDIKRELERLTRPIRERVGPCYTFAPGVTKSDRLNLLDLIQWGTPYDVRDAQRLATHLATAESESPNQQPASEEGQYYKRWARVLLWGSILFIHDELSWSGPRSIRGLLHFFTQKDVTLRQALDVLAKSRDPQVCEVSALVSNRTPRDQAEVFSSAAGWLMPWFDPVLAYSTDVTTIPIDALQQAEYPMTLYLHFSPEDLQGRLRPVARLLIDQLIVRLTTDRTAHDYRHGVKWIFEDMAELGYFPPVEHLTAFYREHGFSVLGIVQSANQLWQTYGRNTALFDNFDTWVVFRPNHPETAKFFAEKLGKTTVTEEMSGTSHQPWGIFGSRQRREMTHDRWLLDPWEIMQVRQDQCLVLVSGLKTILAKARPYFKDRNFRHVG